MQVNWHRLTSWSMALMAASLLAGCGPAEDPIQVGVRNESLGSVYVGSNALPLRIKDSRDVWWSADAGFAGVSCSDCERQCENNIHGDPRPLWIEIPPGQTLPLRWDGRLYQRLDGGCHCGTTCYQPTSMEPGPYSFEVSFEQSLPPDRQPYTSAPSHNGALQTWTGSGLGTAEARQFRIFRLIYDGEREINLVFK